MRLRIGLLLLFLYSNAFSQKEPVFNILVLGNSITIHGKTEKIGWNGNWGMAASSVENDYVHILKRKFEIKYPSLNMNFYNVSELFEKKYGNLDTNLLDKFKFFDADLIIIRLGDNIDRKYFSSHSLDSGLYKLVDYISAKNKKVNVCITNRFWPDLYIDDALSIIAKKRNWIFVDISSLQDNRKNKAIGLFKNRSVAEHPSDLGMKLIADKIWQKIKNL